MTIPREIILLIEQCPGSTVTLSLLRHATGNSVPAGIVGDSDKTKEWLDTQQIRVPLQSPTTRAARHEARRYDGDFISFDGDYAYFDFEGSCDVSVDVRITENAVTRGRVSVRSGDLPCEVSDIDDLVNRLERMIQGDCPDMDYDSDSVFEDVSGDIDWDTSRAHNYDQTEPLYSDAELEAFAEWLIERGYVEIEQEDDNDF